MAAVSATTVNSVIQQKSFFATSDTWRSLGGSTSSMDTAVATDKVYSATRR